MRAFDQSFVHGVECGCAGGVAVFAVEGVNVEVEEEEAGGVENERGWGE